MDEEEFDEEDFSDESYYLNDDETETLDCPSCGAAVYEDSPRCPVCGEYVTFANTGYAWSNRPIWWVLLGLAGILASLATLTLY